MKNFRRSLRYLRPYRGRIAGAIICALLIAVLWGSGLGALLPGAKILISTEGLHGWAYRSLTEDRLGAKLIARPIRGEHDFAGRRLTVAFVLDVIEVDKDGPAKRLGLQDSEWIVGISKGAGPGRFLDAEQLAKAIGTAGGRTVRIAVYDPQTRTGRWIGPLRTAEASFSSRILGALADRLPDNQYKLLLMLLGFGVVITILRDLLRFVQEYIAQTTVYRGLMDLRCENYNVMLRMPTTFFSEQGVSDSMSRFVRDTGELARGQVTLLGKVLVEPGKAIVSVVVAMMFSWRLTLLAMVAGPPAYLLIHKFGKIMRRASRRALESWSSMLAVLEETLTGIRIVKAYTMEGTERRRFFRVNRALLKQQAWMAATDAATAPAVEALGIIAAMGAVAIAGYWVLNNMYDMDRDKFFALLACLAAMYDPVRKLAHVNIRFQRAEAAAARVFELQDRQQEKSLPNAPALPIHNENIEFRGVSFRYPSAADDALKNIDLTINAGNTVAIVGPNGAGKTTLVSLVPRLLDPTAGTILIDGRNIAEYSLRSLRKQIGLVSQDTIIFNATVRDNIAYGRRRAKPETVLAAAKKAFVDEFVQSLPEGYETMIGERGATISGGQRQRIAIARAILRDPAILIFDEALSQVDADSEHKIHRAMEEFVKGRTCFLIAHSFATVLAADRIVVMEGGRIIDTGTHTELLEGCELYRHLYQTQFAATGG